MRSGTRTALGLAGGYLLGRRKKGGLLLLAAALLAAGRGAGGIARRGASLGSGELGHLAEEGRKAVRGLLSSGIEALADRIHDKTEALRGASGRAEGEEQEGEGEEKAEPEGRADAEAPADEASEESDEKAEGEPQPSSSDAGGAPDEDGQDGEVGPRDLSRPRLSGARRGPVTRGSAERGRRNVGTGPARR